MRRTVGGVLLVTSSLVLAGCAGSSASSPSAGASTSWDCSTSSPLSQADWTEHCAGVDNAPPTGGSVTSADGAFVQYPTGLRGEIAAVAVKPNDDEHPDDSHPDADRLLTVTFRLSNTGSTAVQLNADATGPSLLVLYYGQNRYKATSWMTEPDGAGALPQQLVPGTNATFREDFTLPASGLDSLAVTFRPTDTLTPYTFTDVETLLR
jgi:hypothetical protein